MSNVVVGVTVVEASLILVTTLLLTQPKWLFRTSHGKSIKSAKWGGLFFLAVTFCWSIIVGVILSVNNLSLRI